MDFAVIVLTYYSVKKNKQVGNQITLQRKKKPKPHQLQPTSIWLIE